MGEELKGTNMRFTILAFRGIRVAADRRRSMADCGVRDVHAARHRHFGPRRSRNLQGRPGRGGAETIGPPRGTRSDALPRPCRLGSMRWSAFDLDVDVSAVSVAGPMPAHDTCGAREGSLFASYPLIRRV
jgi:hypothetical protein